MLGVCSEFLLTGAVVLRLWGRPGARRRGSLRCGPSGRQRTWDERVSVGTEGWDRAVCHGCRNKASLCLWSLCRGRGARLLPEPTPSPRARPCAHTLRSSSAGLHLGWAPRGSIGKGLGWRGNPSRRQNCHWPEATRSSRPGPSCAWLLGLPWQSFGKGTDRFPQGADLLHRGCTSRHGQRPTEYSFVSCHLPGIDSAPFSKMPSPPPPPPPPSR